MEEPTLNYGDIRHQRRKKESKDIIKLYQKLQKYLPI